MQPIPLEVLLEAKREVVARSKVGEMITPREAWLLSGQKTNTESLWSIAYRIGTQHDVLPEDVNQFLEQQFPQYSMTEGKSHGWDDHHSNDLPW
jgi:hypothetical protein